MSPFERYLTVWVFLCILAGVTLGHALPELFHAIGGLEVAKVNLPVGQRHERHGFGFGIEPMHGVEIVQHDIERRAPLTCGPRDLDVHPAIFEIGHDQRIAAGGGKVDALLKARTLSRQIAV